MSTLTSQAESWVDRSLCWTARDGVGLVAPPNSSARQNPADCHLSLNRFQGTGLTNCVALRCKDYGRVSSLKLKPRREPCSKLWSELTFSHRPCLRALEYTEEQSGSILYKQSDYMMQWYCLISTNKLNKSPGRQLIGLRMDKRHNHSGWAQTKPWSTTNVIHSWRFLMARFPNTFWMISSLANDKTWAKYQFIFTPKNQF